MISRKHRLERLLSVLPRIYAQQPRGSALREVLNALAGVLSELDHHAQVVLRNHWCAFAEGERAGTGLTPLERMGDLLGVPRERWTRLPEDGPGGDVFWEPTDVYRRRLRQTSRVQRAGLCSPLAILNLAATALDCEVMNRAERVRDATIGATTPHTAGVGGAGSEPVQMFLTDNPLRMEERTFSGLRVGNEIEVANNSLLSDYPSWRLQAIGGDLPYPAITDAATGESIIYTGTLAAGSELHVQPLIDHRGEASTDPFRAFDRTDAHPWRHAHPRGIACIDGPSNDVSAQVWYIRPGARFDRPDSRFAGQEATDGPRFAILEQVVRSPLLQAGRTERWRLESFDRTRLVRAGFSPGVPEHATVLDGAPTEGSPSASADLEIEWWVRDPAHFRLRIPRSPYVDKALRRGLFDLIQRSVERARAAVVQFEIDFPEPARQEAHVVTTGDASTSLDAEWREDAGPGSRPEVAATLPMREQHTSEERRFSIEGIQDVTRFEESHFERDEED